MIQTGVTLHKFGEMRANAIPKIVSKLYKYTQLPTKKQERIT